MKVYGGVPPRGTSDESAVTSGVLTGVLLAVLWMFLAWFTHNPISLAGWGVGGLIGLVVAKGSRAPTPSRGTLAVVLTVGTVLLAKALILAFALRPIVRDEIVRDPEATTLLFVTDMTRHRSFSPELQAALDEQISAGPDTARSPRRLEAVFELSERITAEARARNRAATPAERERLVRLYSDSVFARVGFLPALARLLGFWDLVWLCLGVSSAWTLARTVTR